MKLGGQAKATRPVSWLSPPPPCQRKALVALWCAGEVGGHGIWALLCFHWGEVSSSLEGDCLMSCWSPLSQVALSYENRWMFQAPSQAASKCQPWCTQMAFPRQCEGGLWGSELFYKNLDVACNLIRWSMCFSAVAYTVPPNNIIWGLLFTVIMIDLFC